MAASFCCGTTFNVSFHAPFCDRSSAVPVQEGGTAATRCFGEVSDLHARVQASKRVEERTSLSRGWSPSTLAVPVRERPRRLAPKVDHREVKAAMVAGRNGRGTARRARRRTNWAASELQRPPTSSARTTSRHLCERRLGVGAFLSPAGKAQSGATVLPLVPARSSTGIERGHKGGVDSELCSAPKRASIFHNFDARRSGGW